MPMLTIIDRAGKSSAIDGDAGISVMEILRDYNYDVLALCGGNCSCATCHVYIAPDYIDKLPAMTKDENALLDNSPHRKEHSRLSCQIEFSSKLEGLTVTLAPQD